MRGTEPARRVPVGPVPARAAVVGRGRRAGLLAGLLLLALALPFAWPHRPAWAGSAALPRDPASVSSQNAARCGVSSGSTASGGGRRRASSALALTWSAKGPAGMASAVLRSLAASAVPLCNRTSAASAAASSPLALARAAFLFSASRAT